MPLIDPDNIREQFQEAHTAMRPLWDNFDEYERIARNKPHPKVISAKLPTVTDGTLAGIISKTPKRVVQQIPTGRVTSLDQPELAKIVDYIWINYILRNAKYNGSPLTKSWIMLKKALTHGASASYAFMTRRNDYFGVDFSIPYIRDIILEAGKAYGPDCDVLWMRQWFTPGQIQLIIDQQTKLKDRASGRGDTFESKWDVDMLKELKSMAKQKDADAATPQEREKGLHNKFIEIVHGFQVGVGSKFYSFAPDLVDYNKTDTPIIRTDTNGDPRGRMPISFLYADVDLSSALGIGVPEMSGGMQNLLDSEVQSYQLMQKLMLNPPVKKWGADIKKASVKWKPNAVWDMGASKTTSDIEPVNIATEALVNFAQNYGLIKSQIMNTAPNDAATVSATAGNTNSKTPQGVDQLKENLGFDDNYLRKQYEEWWETNAETMLNIHFAKSNGKREIELTEEFIENEMPGMTDDPKQTAVMSPDPAKQKAIISYAQIKSRMRFEVDPTTSESPDDEDQIVRLQEVIKEVAEAPYAYYYLLNAGYKLNLGEAYQQLFQRLGLTNIDKIVTKLPDDTDMPSELRGVLNPLYDKPKIDIRYPDVPAAAQVQALANAGITVTMEDVLAGPVLDQNIRGVDTPPTETAPLLPSGNSGVPPAAGADGQPLATQPTTQVPQGGEQPAAPTAAPAPAEGAPAMPAPQISPEERTLLQALLHEGYSAKQALAGLNLAKKGMTTEQIQQTLGKPEGLSMKPKAAA